MFKKFLLFFSIAVVLLGSLVGVYFKYVHSFEYPIFLESYEHGMLSVNSEKTIGADNKYRVTCKAGEMLTVNINPERTDSTYYNLDALTVNGENVTNQVKMLQYRFKVTKSCSLVATFKKGTRPEEKSKSSDLDYPNTPVLSPAASTPYLGSAGAYNFRDPSVIYDEKSGYYYAFGSDNVVARSKDLINWVNRTTYFEEPRAAEDSSVMDFSQFDCVQKWAENHGYDKRLSYSSVENDRTPLAPEIVKVGERYFLYFSLSKQKGANESAIFCVSTTDIENAVKNKQWEECGLVLSSCGHHKITKSDNDEEATSAKYDESNAVHPSVIADANGKMYLTYGSYFGKESISGGIYLLELDMDTGLLKKNSKINSTGNRISTIHKNKNESFKTGVLLARPGSSPSLSKNEGSLVSACDLLYRNGYYYLFMTYGVEEKNYEIRVAKSKNIDGPYLDTQGNDVSKFSNSFGKDQYSKGDILIAGYNFLRSSNGKVSYTNIGKAAPGSPCVFESKDGEWIIASQSQLYFKHNGELLTGLEESEKNELEIDALPTLETRQLMWTNDGSPLLVPESYAKETLAPSVTPEQMYGNWDVITFEKDADKKDYTAVRCNRSQVVSFFKDATISQNDILKEREVFDLHFSKKDSHSFEAEINGEAYTIYPIVVWDWELSEGTLAFIGTSESGNTVWGKKSFSPYTGVYADAFYYLLSQADNETRAEFEEKLDKISADPSQEQLDALTSKLLKRLRVQTLR